MSGMDLFGGGGGDDLTDPLLRAGGTLVGLPADSSSALPQPKPDATESELDALVTRERERQERARIAGIQDELRTQTTQRSRGYGLRALLSGTLGRLSSLGSG